MDWSAKIDIAVNSARLDVNTDWKVRMYCSQLSSPALSKLYLYSCTLPMSSRDL